MTLGVRRKGVARNDCKICACGHKTNYARWLQCVLNKKLNSKANRRE